MVGSRLLPIPGPDGAIRAKVRAPLIRNAIEWVGGAGGDAVPRGISGSPGVRARILRRVTLVYDRT